MLQGKIALVMGLTSGISLGIACLPAAQDANITMNGFGDVEAPKAQIAAAGKNAIRAGHHGVDTSRLTEIEAMFAYAGAELGGVDILVNNAGIQYVVNVEDFPAERWDAIIAINLTSAFHTMRPAVPGMKRKNWGRIINAISAHGLVASAQKSAYAAAEHGIVDLTKSAVLETAQTDITSNAICPGWALTPLMRKQIGARAEKGGLPALEAKTDLLMEKQPSREFVTPDRFDVLVAPLHNDATEQVRGVAWNMDGDWVAQ